MAFSYSEISAPPEKYSEAGGGESGRFIRGNKIILLYSRKMVFLGENVSGRIRKSRFVVILCIFVSSFLLFFMILLQCIKEEYTKNNVDGGVKNGTCRKIRL